MRSYSLASVTMARQCHNIHVQFCVCNRILINSIGHASNEKMSPASEPAMNTCWPHLRFLSASFSHVAFNRRNSLPYTPNNTEFSMPLVRNGNIIPRKNPFIYEWALKSPWKSNSAKSRPLTPLLRMMISYIDLEMRVFAACCHVLIVSMGWPINVPHAPVTKTHRFQIVCHTGRWIPVRLPPKHPATKSQYTIGMFHTHDPFSSAAQLI